ncbi:hypothetical protein D6D19_08869 [Aureobasidium pullulans]|uniref:CST complex subunit Ten1 n=1 Tax=Aureobasidium pullulans TaxID=5580 RepID=A0A4S8ZQN5_AURPU|nr:hypothetical protein D6D19_08869 [Aureobasidium pullulans]
MTHPPAKPWRLFNRPITRHQSGSNQPRKQRTRPSRTFFVRALITHLLRAVPYHNASSKWPAHHHCQVTCVPSASSQHTVQVTNVNQYHESTALLSLFHNFPSPQDRHIAQVDISQLLDTIDHQNLQVGAWLNIIGYVGPPPSRNRTKIQAIMLWSAGAVNLQQYETALVSRQTT